MVISHTQEFSNEVLSQNVVTNFFHLSNQTDLIKEKSALILTRCKLPGGNPQWHGQYTDQILN